MSPIHRRILLPAAIAAVLCGLLDPAAGQVVLGGRSRGRYMEPAEPPNILPAAPRDVQRRVVQAKAAIAEARYTDAVADLKWLLRAETEDGFLPSAESDGSQTTVKQEARRLLGALPEEGRQSYERQYAPEAKAKLDEALRGADREALVRVANVYFHTPAGYRATLLAGIDLLDRGRATEAAAWFRRLIDAPAAAAQCEPRCSLLLATCWLAAGETDKAREVVGRLKDRYPKLRFRIGDEQFTAASDSVRVVQSLQSAAGPPRPGQSPPRDAWLMHRGDAARTGQQAWRTCLVELEWESQKVEDVPVETVQRAAVEQHVTLLPAAQPLALGDTILSRTPTALLAIDGRTGKLLWDFGRRSDDGRKPPEATNPALRGRVIINGYQPTDRAGELYQRIWEDVPYGQISSDGRTVFLLDGLPAAPGGSRAQAILARGSQGLTRFYNPQQQPSNTLVALDAKKEGKLRWAVGGSSGLEEPKLAGAFFLGPPLPERQWLYVLAEIKGEIVLCMLRADTGRLEWQQRLAQPESGVAADAVRRLAGAVPSLADGVLVCPTSAGAVVAVDPGTRSLLWAYQYPCSVSNATRALGAGLIISQGRSAREGSWIETSATIAGGRALLASAEAGELHCLDLHTGRRQWALAPDDARFVACVHAGKAIVVGATSVTAVDLASGKLAWKHGQLALPASAMPSGRGVHSGRYYYLPTTAAQIVQIDLEEGRAAIELRTDGVLGNLMRIDDRLISQSADRLRQFGPAAQ
jgi:outer membrane protein assembly factor BamB